MPSNLMNYIKRLRLIQMISATLLLAACGSNGVMTSAEKQPAGDEIVQQIEEQVGIYPAEFLTAYVDAVGRRLIAGLATTPYYFRFRIIDQGEPNAFSTANGYIYISRGLLALINSEDELAGILAHQIVHVTQRHHMQQDRRDNQPGVLVLPGQIINKVVAADISQTIKAQLGEAGKAHTATYDLDQENQADRLGMQMAARAGYNPIALATALYNLERTVRLLPDEQHESAFFTSHPTTPERITDIEREAENILWTPAQPFAQSKQDLLDRLNGLSWGANNPMQGILQDQQFMQPDMDISIQFPAGWNAVNTPIFVGAFAPNNQALIILGSAERPGSVAEVAADFLTELSSEEGLEPTSTDSVELDIGPAYLVQLEDTSGELPASIYYMWVNTRGTTFRFIAAGTDLFRDQLRDTVLSLRNMTSEEKASIANDHIRTITANAGESIQELSERTGNLFSPEMTTAVNGLPDITTLKQHQLIKILYREPYLR
ncbi:MAG: M48 family metalloprotease [Gammaproteobacteria bacterium]|nr:M48 family metalloprotease [Gammaproteobacteria bacterium]